MQRDLRTWIWGVYRFEPDKKIFKNISKKNWEDQFSGVTNGTYVLIYYPQYASQLISYSYIRKIYNKNT